MKIEILSCLPLTREVAKSEILTEGEMHKEELYLSLYYPSVFCFAKSSSPDKGSLIDISMKIEILLVGGDVVDAP